jgi:hypothetical protein
VSACLGAVPQMPPDIGNGQWDILALRRLLGEILPQHQIAEDFEVEHDFPSIGRKTMQLRGASPPTARTQQGRMFVRFDTYSHSGDVLIPKHDLPH